MQQGALHLFTAAQYNDLPHDEFRYTELIEGLIYDMSPTGNAHRYAVVKLDQILQRGLQGTSYLVQVENSVSVPDWTGKDAPKPDVAIIQDKYEAPTADDTFAVIEVSDTTYDWDRNTKIPIYVKAGISAYIVNIELRQVEWYDSVDSLKLPHGQIYDIATNLNIMGVWVAVVDLFAKGTTS